MTVTDIRTRHSWDKKPRRDKPEHHIYTYRRDTCGLKKRHELVDGVWIWVWRWPDGGEGSGPSQPSCGEQAAGAAPEGGTEPAVVPGTPAVTGLAAPASVGVTHPCSRCVPPLTTCGQPTRLYTGGWMCAGQADAAARARAGVA